MQLLRTHDRYRDAYAALQKFTDETNGEKERRKLIAVALQREAQRKEDAKKNRRGRR
jgi:hypothetical protein